MHFVTMTFSEDSIMELTPDIEYIIENEIATIAVRRFLERWRKSTNQRRYGEIGRGFLWVIYSPLLIIMRI